MSIRAGPRKMVMLPNIAHYGIYAAKRKRAITLAIERFDRYVKRTGPPIKSKESERGECSPFSEPQRVTKTRMAAAQELESRTHRRGGTDMPQNSI